MKITEEQIRRIAGRGGSRSYSTGSGGSAASGSTDNAANADHATSAANLDSDSSDWTTIDNKDAAVLQAATEYSDAQDKAQDTANESKFLRKDQDDSTEHSLAIGGKLTVNGTTETNGLHNIDGDIENDGKFSNAGDATFGSDVDIDGTASTGDINNKGTVNTANLNVTGAAHFHELIIDKIRSTGGSRISSPADGFTVDIVEAVTGGYRLYWLAENDGKASANMWQRGDGAICMNFNAATTGTTHNVSNHYYWSRVTAVSGATPVEKATTEGGVSVTRKYHYIQISTATGGYAAGCTVDPVAGDEVVMLGYRKLADSTDATDITDSTDALTDTEKRRQSAIYESSYDTIDPGLTAPLWATYQGIDDFTLDGHRVSYVDATRSCINADVLAIAGSDVAGALAALKIQQDNVSAIVERRNTYYRNLLQGSDLTRTADGTPALVVSDSGTVEVSTSEKYDGTASLHVSTSTANSYDGMYFSPVSIAKSTAYHVSVYAKGTGTLTIEMVKKTAAGAYGQNRDTAADAKASKSFALTGAWQLCEMDFTTDDSHDYIELNFFTATAADFYLSRPMLETGSQCTGWTLSPEDPDTESRLTALEQTATSIEARVEADGKVLTGIGMTEEGIASTGKTFVWRQQDGTEVARFDNNGGSFSGTVKATNFYHSVCVNQFQNYAYYVPTDSERTETEQENIDGYTDTDHPAYPYTGGTYLSEDALDEYWGYVGLRECTGNADIVIVPASGSTGTQDRYVTLPRSQDFGGKIIELFDPVPEADRTNIYVTDVGGGAFSAGVRAYTTSSGSMRVEMQSSPPTQLTLKGSARFFSMQDSDGIYHWLHIA